MVMVSRVRRFLVGLGCRCNQGKLRVLLVAALTRAVALAMGVA